MKLNEDFKIEDQRRRIISSKPFLALVAPCKINDGISPLFLLQLKNQLVSLYPHLVLDQECLIFYMSI
jgi:hypothetical protein